MFQCPHRRCAGRRWSPAPSHDQKLRHTALAITYDGVVNISTQALLPKLRSYGALSLSALTLSALIIHPVPWCFDCEFPNAWGHVDGPADVVLSAWLLIAPFLAGLFGVRRGWIVPVCMVLALLVTQPIGGVEWWSLRANEGPVIIMLGVPLTAASFGLGYLVRGIGILAKSIINRHPR